MKKEKKRNRIRCGRSERLLKITAVTVSLLFAALMLYPMIFAVSSSMKDNSQIYKVPPKLLPGKEMCIRDSHNRFHRIGGSSDLR